MVVGVEVGSRIRKTLAFTESRVMHHFPIYYPFQLLTY